MTTSPEKIISSIIWILSFSSIFCLLAFLYRIMPMHEAGLFILSPSLIIIGGLWILGKKKNYHRLTLALKTGFWGGILGVLGYDLIRLPLHFLGLNPLTPIRSYGMYLLDAPYSTLASDLAGFFYHFSNGITFAWIYTLIALGKNRWWAVAWGIVLELLAYMTSFGEVYALRTNLTAFWIGLGAHFFFGYPLGWLAEKPKQRLQWLLNTRKPLGILGMTFGMAILISFFAFAWEPITAPRAANTLYLGPDALSAGWNRVEIDRPFTLQNLTKETIRYEIPQLKQDEVLKSQAKVGIHFPTPGIYQIRTPDTGWRSAFISVEKEGYPVE
ncbi:MAG: hypothetical protein U1C97_03070 [Candidatus Gracilibacteria bacterium]|nr:hypothetical protein [bacterium]MDZ4217274.1 hypothetical protein [Candidatus Gracilibacteria bacterium]